jgi:glutamyl-tRNA reductase
VLPVNLLPKGRRGLVVGGGVIAARKAGHLAVGGAEIEVVSPDVTDDLKALAEAGDVTWTARPFQDSDVNSAFVVFAATNDRDVNRHIVELCRQKDILCSSADGNWPNGDFVTPATFRKENLTVSVATGGQSCRRSRLVKDSLARHVAMVETANLVVIGTSHHQLSLAEREPYHMAGERAQEVGRMLAQVWGIHEFMILNTCNRVEVWAAVSAEALESGLVKQTLAFDHLPDDRCYVKHGYEAFAHSAVTTAGLLSQTPGENHIVAQVKEALAASLEANWAGSLIRDWVGAALRVSKAIRAEAGPLLRDFEIEDLCLDFVDGELPDPLSSHSVLLLGSGVVGKAVLDRVLSRGAGCDWCYHVNQPEVPDGAKEKVNLFSFNRLREQLSEVDVILCTTAHSGYVLHKAHAPFLNQERNVLIVDLSIPRNVDPELEEAMDNIRIVDLDDLKHWYRREAADLDAIRRLADETVTQHRDLYDRIVATFTGGHA